MLFTSDLQELQAIFDVIGTPEWACVETVENPRWRHFLWRLPAQAPHLMRLFGFAGEPAVDLIRRMLAFDPHRRWVTARVAAYASHLSCVYCWVSPMHRVTS